jgi:hypothetical protein
MIKIIILLGIFIVNTSAPEVKSADVRVSWGHLNHARKVATLKNQPQPTDWYSRSSLVNRNRVKAVHLQNLDFPPVNNQKRCSDMDTVLSGCKEQPGSIEEAHQRTALAYSRSSGSH